MYQPQKITKSSIKNNENAPTVLPASYLFDVSITPNVFAYILKDYHDFVYLSTHYLNYMLKAQFRQIFKLTESAGRNRFDSLVKLTDEEKETKKEEMVRKNEEYYIFGKAYYKGSHCIFPLHRAYEYSKINFPNEKKKRLVYHSKESTMLRGVMQTEYWLRYGDLMVDELNFLPEYFPKELNREKPFDYHETALFWMIKNFEGNYNNPEKRDKKKTKGYAEFARKSKQGKLLIDKEVPEVDIEALDKKAHEEYRKKHPDSIVSFGLEGNEKAKLIKENELSFRFRNASDKTKKQYVSQINKAAFETLRNSDVYVTKVVPLENKKYFDPYFEMHLVIFHLPNNGASRYNDIITTLQKITCYQHISVKLNITIVTHSEKSRDEAYYTWKQTVKRRAERTDRVNLEARGEKDRKRLKQGKQPIGITESDIRDYCKTSNKYCGIDEVKFVNLEIDRYFSHHKAGSNDFDPGKLEDEYL